jgi:hypothetical protein
VAISLIALIQCVHAIKVGQIASGVASDDSEPLVSQITLQAYFLGGDAKAEWS